MDKLIPQGKKPVDKEVLNDELDAMKHDMDDIRMRQRVMKRYGNNLTDAHITFYTDILREEDRIAAVVAARKHIGGAEGKARGG